MKIASNVTDKFFKCSVQQICWGKSFYVRMQYCVYRQSSLGSDFMSTASNALQKVIQVVFKKSKNYILCNI